MTRFGSGIFGLPLIRCGEGTVSPTVKLKSYAKYSSAVLEAGDDKFYDLMGRELPEAPIGQIYIQNRKRHFRFE